ncbi:MAG: hypothetical protein NVS2B12_07510 [Ktedonobacteraceae bacterium]
MCHNKSRHRAEHMDQQPAKPFRFWGMPFLPFLVVMFFIFGPHTLPFADFAWNWIVPLVFACIFFAKSTRIGSLFQGQSATCEKPSAQQFEGQGARPYQQVSYKAPAQEMYQEGGKQYYYPQQDSRESRESQESYEQPVPQYPHNVPVE